MEALGENLFHCFCQFLGLFSRGSWLPPSFAEPIALHLWDPLHKSASGHSQERVSTSENPVARGDHLKIQAKYQSFLFNCIYECPFAKQSNLLADSRNENVKIFDLEVQGQF